MKKASLLTFILFSFISLAEAQVSAGINLQSSETFVTIGTNPDAQLFGEGRVSTGDFIDLEIMGGYNFIQREEVNLYLGMAVGTDNDFYVGIPFGLLVKPFSASRNFGVVLEAAPIFPEDRRNYFRAGFGFKYTFR